MNRQIRISPIRLIGCPRSSCGPRLDRRDAVALPSPRRPGRLRVDRGDVVPGPRQRVERVPARGFARTPAQGFYERFGLTTRSDVWEEEGIGPHVVMAVDLEQMPAG